MRIRIQSRARKVSTSGVRWPSMVVARSEDQSLKRVRRTPTQNTVQHSVLGLKQNEWGFLLCQAGTHDFNCNFAHGKRPTENSR